MTWTERQIVSFARGMAIVSLTLALVIAYGLGASYTRYIQWTNNTHASLISAIAEESGTHGAIALEIELQSPGVGYLTEIESLEFAIHDSNSTIGYYRIIIPDRQPVLTKPNGSTRFSLHTSMPEEHWHRLTESSRPQLDGRLIVRLYLPNKEVPTRIPIKGLISIGGAGT